MREGKTTQIWSCALEAMLPAMRRCRVVMMAALLSSNYALAALAASENPCEREIVNASRRHGVPVGILYAVGLTETGRRGTMQPYAMNLEGKTKFAGSLEEAVRSVNDAKSDGLKLIDVGCMQINLYYHEKSFSSLHQIFDPASNVDYAARFLKELFKRHGSWTVAAARYHAGASNEPAQVRYVCAVLRNMIATGFAVATEEAKEVCPDV